MHTLMGKITATAHHSACLTGIDSWVAISDSYGNIVATIHRPCWILRMFGITIESRVMNAFIGMMEAEAAAMKIGK